MPLCEGRVGDLLPRQNVGGHLRERPALSSLTQHLLGPQDQWTGLLCSFQDKRALPSWGRGAQGLYEGSHCSVLCFSGLGMQDQYYRLVSQCLH